MRIHAFIMVLATCSSVAESSAWSLSNIMLSGLKSLDIFTESVLMAVEKGMEECRHQFRWERWGCPRSSFNLFSKTHKEPATKEMAYLHAVVSSAIVIHITRNCSAGHFNSSCGCDMLKKDAAPIDWDSFWGNPGTLAKFLPMHSQQIENSNSTGYNGVERWSWGGCSDNVRTGNRMAKHYLDYKENGRDLQAQINRHNNKVGRTMVRKTMKKICKCHGVSGSCETQTCWMRVLDLRDIGEILKKAYDNAKPFSTNRHNNNNNENNQAFQSNNRRRSNRRDNIRKRHMADSIGIPKTNLAFLEESPDYCKTNFSAGFQGTIGRECSQRQGKNVTKEEKNSCKHLCRSCGRRIKMKLVDIESTCKCKFDWCCKVKCKTCIHQVMQYVCV